MDSGSLSHKARLREFRNTVFQAVPDARDSRLLLLASSKHASTPRTASVSPRGYTFSKSSVGARKSGPLEKLHSMRNKQYPPGLGDGC